MKDNRYYGLEVIIYPYEGFNRENFNFPEFITNWLFSPFHDKDKNDKGENVKPHYHLYLFCSRSKSFRQISVCLNRFNDGLCVLPTNVTNICSNKRACYDYSFHKDMQPQKALYDENDILCNDLSVWTQSFNNNKAYQILEDLESGCTLRSMAQKYGRDFVINYSRYKEFLCLMQKQEHPVSKREYMLIPTQIEFDINK